MLSTNNNNSKEAQFKVL